MFSRPFATRISDDVPISVAADRCLGRESTEKRMVRRHNLIGVDIAATDYVGVSDAVIDAAENKRSLTVSALAVHGIMTGALDPHHRRRLNALDMLVPDGQPVRWALNLLFRAQLRDRVYGPKLMHCICERAETLGLSVGLYGNRIETLNDLRRQLLEQYPRLRLAALMPSRFSRIGCDEQAEIACRISESGVNILFVGLGCPRQEVWLYENRAWLDIPLIAVGAAFDFHAKRLVQAPAWMQERGLEWLFRLYHEPRRLWRRYLLLNPLYLILIGLQIVGVRLALQKHSDESVPYEGYA